VRFEWGLAGAAALSDPAAVVVIVDVLSFTTAVTIAAGRGTAVYPHPWPAPDMDAFALTHDAKCAVDRRQVDAHHPWSLSPAHLLSAPVADRLVLPSPNGSAIAVSAGAHTVIAGSLRNATAVGQWLCEHRWGCPGRPIVIIAAGERWPGGELRPALEDLLGAGAIIAAVSDPDASSPEATAALAAWHAHRGHLTETLESCSSGRELIDAGYQTDVTIASELDAQTTIPVLTDSAFRSVQTS
jgi:2-phosphosulfolactate phosphatase